MQLMALKALFPGDSCKNLPVIWKNDKSAGDILT